MAFTVSVAESVFEYIEFREGLTRADLGRIFSGLNEELGERADRFLPRNPHPFLVDRFWYDFVLMTESHEIRAFRFACSAEGHVFGVTEVLYAEEWPDDAV